MIDETFDYGMTTAVNDVVVEKENFEGIVKPSSLNVRSFPSVEGGVVKTIRHGDVVDIVDEEGDWYRIDQPVSGFVMKKFIDF